MIRYDFLSCVKGINSNIDSIVNEYQKVREPLIEYCGMDENICEFCSYVFTDKNMEMKIGIMDLLKKLGYSNNKTRLAMSVERFLSDCVFGDRFVEVSFFNGDYVIKEGQKNLNIEAVLNVVSEYIYRGNK